MIVTETFLNRQLLYTSISNPIFAKQESSQDLCQPKKINPLSEY